MLTVAIGAIAAGLVIAPLVGLIVGVVLALVVGRPRRRGLLTLCAVGLVAASSLYVLQLQVRYHFPTKIEWPEHFDRVALLPWVAAALLLADAVIDHLRSLRRSPPDV
jgi:tetrahydromethanopterin S-methyltransferase subunit C